MEKIDTRIRQCKELAMARNSRIFLLCNNIFVFCYLSQWNLYGFSLRSLQSLYLLVGSTSFESLSTWPLYCFISFLYCFFLSFLRFLYCVRLSCHQCLPVSVNFSTGQHKLLRLLCVTVFGIFYILTFNMHAHMYYGIGVKCVYISLTFHSDSCLPDRCLKVIKLY